MKYYKIDSKEDLANLRKQASQANRKVVDLTVFGETTPTKIAQLKEAAKAWTMRLKPDDIVVSDIDLSDVLGPTEGNISELEVDIKKSPKIEQEQRPDLKIKDDSMPINLTTNTGGNGNNMKDNKKPFIDKEKRKEAVNVDTKLPTPKEIFANKNRKDVNSSDIITEEEEEDEVLQ